MTLYRYKIVVQYDGTNYHGWQIQKNHKTIQGELEKALSDFISQRISILLPSLQFVIVKALRPVPPIRLTIELLGTAVKSIAKG